MANIYKKKDGETPAQNQQKSSGKAAAFFSNRRNVLLLIICGLLVVIVAVLLVSVFLLPQEEEMILSQSGSAGSAVSQQLYDKDAFQFKPEKFVGTVLPQTEDAGMDYVKETLFLGDSNTERMLYYSDVTGVTLENGFGVVGMGIGTFETQGCAKFEGSNQTLTMPQVAELLQPRRIVITFGTNNVGMFVDKFIDQYREALQVLKKAAPHSDIIIGSIFPVDQYRQNTSITMQNIDQMNEALAELAKEQDVKFLNWSEALRDEKTGYSQFESTIQDGVHLSRVGMQGVFDYFRTHSYITEDSRPASSLKAPPARIGTMPGTITRDPKKVAGPIDWSKVAEKAASKKQAANSVTESSSSSSSSSSPPSSSSSSQQEVVPEVPSTSSSSSEQPPPPPAASSSSSEQPPPPPAASSSSSEQTPSVPVVDPNAGGDPVPPPPA